MKLAPWIAGAALVTVVVALSTAKAVNPPERTTMLDVSAVDTLEVHSNRNVEIEIDSRVAASARYKDSTDSSVRTRRQGSRLVVSANIADGNYEDLKVSVPASVSRFVLDEGQILTKEHVPMVEVLVRGRVNWNGDAGRLVMRDAKDRSHARACACGTNTTFSVGGGRINEALFYSPMGHVELGKPDAIGVVYAWLGKEGAVSMEDAQRFDHIHLVKSKAEMPDLAAQLAAP